MLGDSHVLVYGGPQFLTRMFHCKFDVVSVGGATASGLDNPNSKTNAYDIFSQKIDESVHDSIIICLGEVDTGFVIWFRAKKYEEEVDAMLSRAVDNYTKLISKCQKKANTIVVSTPLPTIEDDNNWGEVANLRKEINVSQQERTELTLKFNRLIKDYCNAKGITYVDVDEESLGADGLVNNSLLNQDNNDHHYAEAPYSNLLIKHLKQAI